jgi:hypothetical protein
MRAVRFLVPLAAAASLLLAPGAVAGHGSADDASPNMLHLANLLPPPEFTVGPANEVRNNSDLAFWQDLAFVGNYDGFRVIDIKDPSSPSVVKVVECRANQGDLSVYQSRNRVLLIQSIEEPVVARDCASARDTLVVPGTNPVTNVASTFRQKGWEGLRIFDVTDPAAPEMIAFVPTACGSHTHTTIRDDRNQRAIVYVSSYPSGLRVTRREDLATLPEQPNCIPDHNKISIVEIPDRNPEGARVLKEQPLDSDTAVWTATGNGGSPVRGCHDITVFEFSATRKVAGAACLSEGQLWDVSDPANPTTNVAGQHTHIRNPFIDGPTPPMRGLFHTASFTWDGEIVLFTDEWQGGGAHGCDGPQDTRGNVWFYRNVTPGTSVAPLYGRYMIPRVQPAEDVCTLHNGNVIPTTEGYYGVSSSYEGGTTVFDFSGILDRPTIPQPLTGTETIPLVATEVAYFDAKQDPPAPAGADDTWSSYWYNDNVFTNGGFGRPGNRGFDAYMLLGQGGRLAPPVTDAGAAGVQQFRARKFRYMNPQTQSVGG